MSFHSGVEQPKKKKSVSGDIEDADHTDIQLVGTAVITSPDSWRPEGEACL